MITTTLTGCFDGYPKNASTHNDFPALTKMYRLIVPYETETKNSYVLATFDSSHDTTAPTIAPIPALTAKVDGFTTYQLMVGDNESGTLTYSLVDYPLWVTIDANTGFIMMKPAHSSEGSYRLKVRVTDGNKTAEAMINLTVESSDYEFTRLDYSETVMEGQTSFDLNVDRISGFCGEDSRGPTCDLHIASEQTLTYYEASLTANGKWIKGDVLCNDILLNDGIFNGYYGEHIVCQYGYNELVNFRLGSSNDNKHKKETNLAKINIEINHIKGTSAGNILEALSYCESDNQICLAEIDAFDIEDVWQELENDAAIAAFLKVQSEKTLQRIGKASS